jgi:PAS domain S-box-containing protein
MEQMTEMEVITLPVIVDENVKGLISFVNPNVKGNINLKAMKAFRDMLTQFIENILINEKLMGEVKEKTNSLEQQKNNLEDNVRERTVKLDNSRSALLYMLKDIEKARKKLSSAKEYTDNIIRSMIETLIVMDTKGVIQKVNKSTSDLLGYSEAELIGKHISYIFPEKGKNAINKLIVDFLEKNIITNIERTYLTKDGIEIPVIFSGSVMKEADNMIQGIVCVASDITIRKKHEKEVQDQNKKIEQTNIELIEALHKAEESDKLKTAFLQNMSHEIRTPLNGIVGFSQLLSSKNYPEANKLEIAKLVERSSFRLIELVNNILDIAKIETGQVNINSTAFNLNGFMRELKDFFELFVKEKKLTLDYQNSLEDDECIIFLDKEKLHQIMVNLINNSIKFTNEGGVIFGYTIQKNLIEFFVRDTGVGIPEEMQERVFDRFTQADVALTRNYEGSGLGLSICKGLTELLGGKMWLKSAMGKETTFYFTVPYLPTNMKNGQGGSALFDLEKIRKKLKILVAEDDEINFKFVEYLFLHSKHNLTWAANGQEAVDLFIHKDDFDIVLMDLKMPIMSGYEASTIIRSRFSDVPILALTAYAFEEDKQRALDAGCTDFLQKAYKKDDLFEKIIKLVK